MGASAADIVDAVRTAAPRRGGRASELAPGRSCRRRSRCLGRSDKCGPRAIDDVIMGCVSQAGGPGFHIGRNAVLSSRLPESVPAVSVDRQCGSSQQAIQFAAQAAMSGTQDVVIAAGVESMTRVPILSPVKLFEEAGLGRSKSARQEIRYPGVQFSQFSGAEALARQYSFGREDLDRFALASHQKAAAATHRGDFADEIVPIEIVATDGHASSHVSDEEIRFDASLETIGAVKLLREDGMISAANASQICDGASAALIVSEEGLKRLNLTPNARIVNMTVTADDPVIMLEEPLFATRKAPGKAGLSLDDIDLYEVNEAFAPVPLAWLKHFDGDPERLNVNGGSIALGHPLGASGAKLMATLIHALARRGKRYGLQTMCEAGGMANVTIVERL